MTRPISLPQNPIISPEEPVLVTGASGFIGARVVAQLLRSGFTDVRCLVRPTSSMTRLDEATQGFPRGSVRVIAGNLLGRRDCSEAATNVRVVYHVAAGIEKSYAGCYLNSVVSTRNLLDVVTVQRDFRRFVNVSSFAVYSSRHLKRSAVLDEHCALESDFVARHDPYGYAKLKQDEIVAEYSVRHGIPHVIVRPGAVYGPGKRELSARIGIDTFGIFLHLGGRNRIPLTYVDNCAAAIVLAGITAGIDGEVFNVVDDDLPRSRDFLRQYEQQVRRVRHVSVPYSMFYGFSWLWELYSSRSGGQLPPAFNRRRCAAFWKGNSYSNQKLKTLLGWTPAISFQDGRSSYFEYLRGGRGASC